MPEFKTATGLLYYEVSGPPEAPPLTLLHNFMSSGRSAWGPLLPALTKGYRVLLPDLPGHGRSQGYPPGFHHLEMAHQLAQIMAFEGTEQGGKLAGTVALGEYGDARWTAERHTYRTGRGGRG